MGMLGVGAGDGGVANMGLLLECADVGWGAR